MTDYSKTVEVASALIKEFESFEAKGYPDPLIPSLITIGWGFTYDYNRSKRFSLEDTTSEFRSEPLLHHIIYTEIIPTLEKIPAWGLLGSNQRAALIDFSFNLGHNFYGTRGFETISLCLRTGQNAMSLTPNLLRAMNDFYPKPLPTDLQTRVSTGINFVPVAFLLYRNPGTVVERGLLRRRIAEAQLWRTPDGNN
jgi:lysozyme